jgi:hypothetical protein
MRLQSEHRHAGLFRTMRAEMEHDDACMRANVLPNIDRVPVDYSPVLAFAALVDVAGHRLLSFAAVHPRTVTDYESCWREQCGTLLGREKHDCLLLDFHVRPGQRTVWDGVSDLKISISLRMASMLDPYDLPGGCAIEALMSDRRALYAIAGLKPARRRPDWQEMTERERWPGSDGRIYNAARSAGIRTPWELAKMTDAQLLKLPNLGRKSLGEIREWQARTCPHLIPNGQQVQRL